MKRLDTFYIVQKYFTGPNLFASDKDDLSTYVSNEGKKIPSKEQIDAKIEELKAEWEAEEWKRKRQSNYPDIGDQLDALYHAGLFPKEMAAKLKAVKEKYPKPVVEEPKPELKDGN
jgi:hypothetical protein